MPPLCALPRLLKTQRTGDFTLHVTRPWRRRLRHTKSYQLQPDPRREGAVSVHFGLLCPLGASRCGPVL